MTEESVAAFARAGELVEKAEPSPTVARVISRLAMPTMLRGEYDVTIELCERALGIADELGLDDLRSHVLNTRGVARVGHGDVGGLSDLEASIQIAEGLNAADAIIRGCKNPEARSRTSANSTAPRHSTNAGSTRTRLRSRLPGHVVQNRARHPCLLGRRLGLGLPAFGDLDAWVAEFGPHYMQAAAHSTRAKLRAARGNSKGARADIESALDFCAVSRTTDALSHARRCSVDRSDRREPRRRAAGRKSLRRAVTAATDGAQGGYWTVPIAIALSLTDQSHKLAAVPVDGPSRWIEIARAATEGKFSNGADMLTTIGAMPEEALARLLAARSHVQHGRMTEGESELQQALNFWSRVGATQYLGMAEALLTKTA